MKRSAFATILGSLAVGTCLATVAGAQEKVLRIGMTAADIPRTLGQPDQGFEGNRFTGIPIYDSLTQWDLSKANEASVLIPGVATEWKVDDADKTKWVFRLRPGVKFHDGSSFNADAVVWNVHKVLDKAAPHFDPSQVGVTASRMPTLRIARKIDDMTVELTTSEPDSFLPINLDKPFHGLARPLGGEAEGGAGVRHRPGRALEAGLGGVRGRPVRLRPVPGHPLRVARAARACEVPASIGTRSAGRRSTRWCSCRCPRRTRAPRRCSPARSTGSRRRRPTRRRRSSSAASRSTRTPSRMSGPGSSPSSRARPGST